MKLLTVSLLLWTATLAIAQRPLTEQEAVNLALASNPELQVLRAGTRVAEAGRAQARALDNPVLKLGATDLSAELNDADRKRSNVGLAWSPPRIGSMALKTAMVQATVDESAATVAAAENRLAAEVRLLHRTICLLEEQVRLADAIATARERILADVNLQVKAGVKSVLDRSMAEMALAESKPLAAQYRAERQLQAIRLQQRIGMPRNERLLVQADADAFQVPAAEWPREALLTEAVSHRAELSAANARCRGAALAVTEAQREKYPWISSVQLIRRTSRVDSPGSWGIQVSVDVPVFTWFRNQPGAVPKAELNRCQLQVQAVKARISSEIEELIARAQAAAAELAGYQQTIVALSQRQIETAKAELAAGQADRVEPLLAEVKLLTVRQVFLNKLMEYRALEAGLRQARGGV